MNSRMALLWGAALFGTVFLYGAFTGKSPMEIIETYSGKTPDASAATTKPLSAANGDKLANKNEATGLANIATTHYNGYTVDADGYSAAIPPVYNRVGSGNYVPSVASE